MKNLIYFFLFMLSMFIFWPQDAIAQDANRGEKKLNTIHLEKVQTIHDDGEKFYFKRPRNLNVDSDGNIFVIDQRQVLMFSPKGQFIANLYNYGEGPGRTVYIESYISLKDSIILFSQFPSKIMQFDKSGKFLTEQRFHCNYSSQSMIFSDGNETIIKGIENNSTQKRADYIDSKGHFIKYLKNGEIKNNDLYSFFSRTFIAPAGREMATLDLINFINCENDKNSFFFSNSPQYEIRKFDTLKSSIVNTIRPPYKRVKTQKEDLRYISSGALFVDGKFKRPPTPEYLDDVICFSRNKDKLWVFTSTQNNDNGILIDAYDLKGNYNSSFFLKLPQSVKPHSLYSTPITVSNDFVYVIENNDGEITIEKYKMIR